MITEDYVSFETAKLLKKKGFDCWCACINHPQCGMSLIGHMINNTDLKLTREYELCIDKENLFTIPTIQMAMKWLRKKHGIHIQILCPVADNTDEPIKYNIVISNLKNHCLSFDTPIEEKEFDSYEEACETAIKYCLENLI